MQVWIQLQNLKWQYAMAREGGIGIIHKNMSIEEQAKEVDRVKRQENGVITDPIFLSPDNTIQDAEDLWHNIEYQVFL